MPRPSSNKKLLLIGTSRSLGLALAEEYLEPADVATDEFTGVMITDALSPVRVVETLQDLVVASGIGIM
jgi:hypothetical protein